MPRFELEMRPGFWPGRQGCIISEPLRRLASASCHAGGCGIGHADAAKAEEHQRPGAWLRNRAGAENEAELLERAEARRARRAEARAGVGLAGTRDNVEDIRSVGIADVNDGGSRQAP